MGLEDIGLPVGSRGKAPVGVWGIKFPWSWSSLQTLFTDFDCRNDQNLKILHNSPPVFFTVGAKWHFWKLSPLAQAWRHHCILYDYFKQISSYFKDCNALFDQRSWVTTLISSLQLQQVPRANSQSQNIESIYSFILNSREQLANKYNETYLSFSLSCQWCTCSHVATHDCWMDELELQLLPTTSLQNYPAI